MQALSRVLGIFLVAAVTVPVPTAAQSEAPLFANVGPRNTIILMTATNARVKLVKAGRYQIVVTDRSRMHNFHLGGPGLNRRTGVAFVGTQTWRVRLTKGVYRYVCDRHVSSMRGAFKAT
jgi:hypothetical protein